MVAKDIFDAPARLPVRTVILSMVVLWAFYFVLTTIRGYIVGFDLQWEMFWRRGVVTLVGLAMTMVLWLLLRLFDSKPLWMKVVAALLFALPIAIPIAQTNQWIFSDIQMEEEERFGQERGVKLRRDESGNLLVDIPIKKIHPVDETEKEVTKSILIAPAPTDTDHWVMIIDMALGRYFLLLAWASLYFALLAGSQARAAERRASEFREAAKAAELRSLRYQVNPHFLFNSLNSLSSLIMTGKTERAENMIQTLSSFYRHSLAGETTSDVELADEFALQKHYLEVEAIRFPDRLITDFDLPQNLADTLIPGMILQPLVENSVKYAVAPLSRPVTIKIAAREDYGRLAITVSDDGPGAQQSAANHGFGIGLANVSDRLEARYGKDATITAGPTPDGYATEIRLPLKHDG